MKQPDKYIGPDEETKAFDGRIPTIRGLKKENERLREALKKIVNGRLSVHELLTLAHDALNRK